MSTSVQLTKGCDGMKEGASNIEQVWSPCTNLGKVPSVPGCSWTSTNTYIVECPGRSGHKYVIL